MLVPMLLAVVAYPGADYLHPKLHFTPTVVSDRGGWHDIAGCITYYGVHHVFQGTGWNHAISTDLIRWQTAPHGPNAVHETYAGMESQSDPCSGFIARDPATGAVCAGFRQCSSSKGVAGGAPWDVPLELRCALDDDLNKWNDAAPEYLFNVSFWRAIPYDPARPWREADGNWYVLLSMDGCNSTSHALPCHAGGMLGMWSSPALRGEAAFWTYVGDVFKTNTTVLSDGFLSKEFVTIDYLGSLPGDPYPEAAGGTGTRLFLNNVGGNGGGDGCCSGTTSYFVVEQPPGQPMQLVMPGQQMVDWGAFSLRPLPLPYDPSGEVELPSSTLGDLILSGQAESSHGPADDATSGSNVRSGGPGGSGTVLVGGGVLAPGHVIERVALSFRYIAGYCGSAPCPEGASTVTVVLTDASGGVLATLYRSPPLCNYSFDNFTQYSPPLHINVTGLSIPNDELVRLAIQISNNQRNIQIPVDNKVGGFKVRLGWATTTTAAFPRLLRDVEPRDAAAAAAPAARLAVPPRHDLLSGRARQGKAVPPRLDLLSGKASRGFSMARTLGSEQVDQVTVPGRRVLIGWTGPAPSDMPFLANLGSAQSISRDLALAPDRSLLQRFVPELTTARVAAIAPADAGMRAEVYATLPAACADAAGLTDACGISVFGDGVNATTIKLLPSVGLVAVNATLQGNTLVRAGPLPPQCTAVTCGEGAEDGWRIHAILDHSILELIVNNATAFVVYVAPASDRAKEVALLGNDVTLPTSAINVWQLDAVNNLLIDA